MYTVLGATGFIGSALVHALRKSGVQLNAPGRDDDLSSGDLGTVFYCIGLTNDYKDRPFDTVEAHASLLSRILKSGNFTKLIYLSSTRLYDGLNTTSEGTDLSLNPANPRHLYDFSKGLGENLCLAYSGGRACVARLSSVYSEDSLATGFMPDLLRRLRQERSFALDSGTGLVRDYVNIDDVVAGLLKMAAQDRPGIVNIASGENVSNRQIVDHLNALGCRITLTRETPPEAPAACDITRLRSLGVRPVSVLSYLEDFIRKAPLP